MSDRPPDALLLPGEVRQGKRMVDRVRSVCDLAEEIMGLDRSVGQRAWIRIQPHGKMFITADPADTLLYTTGHQLAGQSRYRWERRGDGIEWGYRADGD
jgi:hypothetical protein